MVIDDFIQRALEAPSSTGLILDFDGTLSRIVDDPSEAKPLEGVPELLESLSRSYRTVCILSGRQAEDIANKIGVPTLRYIGLYGAEEWVSGELLQPDDAPKWRGMASRLARDAESLLVTESLFGCEVEFKDIAVSIHYRNALDSSAHDAILTWASSAAPRRGFQVGTGRMVIELRPTGVSKAGAFERIVSKHALALAVLAGDDLTDVEAMQRAEGLMGENALRVGVRSAEEPRGLTRFANHLVGSCEGLVELLRRFDVV